MRLKRAIIDINPLLNFNDIFATDVEPVRILIVVLLTHMPKIEFYNEAYQ
jgi:hypothetical protein